MLRPPDSWVWDSWVVRDGEDYHLFYLHAPRSLTDPRLRHARAVIGHASSRDLVEWTELPDALHPSADGWDDLALWTGSVVRDPDGVWRMFYTGLGSGPHGLLDQRIGVAASDDLVTWRRDSATPVVEVDRRWYQTLDDDRTASETWRDPFVFGDPAGDRWHMLITARLRGGLRNENGVIGHATSADLRTWTVGEPVSSRGGFGQIEVPQVHLVDGVPLLVFTCHPDEQSERWRDRYPHFSTWSVAGDSLLGPWDLTRAKPFTAEPDLFAAPVVQGPDGRWVILGFRNLEHAGIDAFELIDPIEVGVRDGALAAVARVDA